MIQHLDLDALQAAALGAKRYAESADIPLTAKAHINGLATFADGLIDRLRKAEAASKWISVDERLPEIGQGVIAYRPTAHLSNDPPITITFFAGGERNESWQGVRHGFDCLCHPSHWMPLPAAPTSTPTDSADSST